MVRCIVNKVDLFKRLLLEYVDVIKERELKNSEELLEKEEQAFNNTIDFCEKNNLTFDEIVEGYVGIGANEKSHPLYYEFQRLLEDEDLYK